MANYKRAGEVKTGQFWLGFLRHAVSVQVMRRAAPKMRSWLSAGKTRSRTCYNFFGTW